MIHPYVPPKLDYGPPNPEGLAKLETQLAGDLAALGYPADNWVPQTKSLDGPVADVVIIGGGMCGMLAWFALWSAGVRNSRIIDRNPKGREGPWVNYARMQTLRSPKTLPGPALGIPALTFEQWFRAGFGDAQWQTLDKIPRVMWMEYLRWYRQAIPVPVENNLALDLVEPAGDLLRLQLSDGSVQLTRKLVMATGRDGTGRPHVPGFVDGLARKFWAHSADDIDFAALKGRRVAVIGVGASAVDNAAEALEAGALEVRHLIRRKEMPSVNKMMGIGSPGFTAGYRELSDEWRWRFMQYSFATQTPSPRGSTLRVSRHSNAHFHFGYSVEKLTALGDEVEITFTSGERLVTDFIILGTGFITDPMMRHEFGPAADKIRLWRHAYSPPENERNADLGSFPYLGKDFTFQQITEGDAPWIENVYCFNYGTAASLGKVSGDIPGVSEGAGWLSDALIAKLFEEDVQKHWQALQDFDRPELLGDEWTATPLPQRANHD